MNNDSKKLPIIATDNENITIYKLENDAIRSVLIEVGSTRLIARELEMKELRELFDDDSKFFDIDFPRYTVDFRPLEGDTYLRVQRKKENICFTFTQNDTKWTIDLKSANKEKLLEDLLASYPRRKPDDYTAEMDAIRNQNAVPVPAILTDILEEVVFCESVTDGEETLTFIHPTVKMSVGKKAFASAVKTNYIHALTEAWEEVEGDEQKMEKLNDFKCEISTEFAGCFDSFEIVLIQDDLLDNDLYRYAVIFVDPFLKGSENVSVHMTWRQFLAYCDYFFETLGMKEEVMKEWEETKAKLEQERKDEEFSEKEALENYRKRPSAESEQIDIIPASFAEYDAVWVSTEAGTIALDESDLPEFYCMLEEHKNYEECFYSVGSPMDTLLMKWEKEQLLITVKEDGQTKSFVLSEDSRMKLIADLSDAV